ncbi:MAG: hypothetical protein PHF00_01765 [Elusimicrobia bacterium]|nr:hypothetical protein [Elusimicrobiota bacterium]
MDSRRAREVAAFIRENTGTVPWPKAEEILLERGYSAEEIQAGLDQVLPGQSARRRSARIRGGLVGAAAGVAVWLLLRLVLNSGILAAR